MDLKLLERGLEHARKKEKWLLIFGALGFTCYGGYRVYNSPSAVKKRQRLSKLFAAFVSIAEMMSDSAETIGILSKDLKEFLSSDSDQVPQSLKQISKLTNSSELTESLTTITRAFTLGILRGYSCHQHELIIKGGNKSKESGLSDRVVDKLLSDAGSGFASVVVGSFARNLVMALYSQWEKYDPKLDHSKWVGIVCEDNKCRDLIGDCVRSFVGTAVAVYLDKTMNINTYDEFFSGLSNPKHEGRVKGMLVSVCNGGVETFVRTSLDVLTQDSVAVKKLNSKIDFEDGFIGNDKSTFPKAKLADKNRESGGGGWVGRKMCSTRNRKFVLDMTRVVTFQTVRSFLEFVLQKVLECMKRSADVVQHEVVDRGVEAIRYVSSSGVTTVCLTLCLNILNSPWILAPPY